MSTIVIERKSVEQDEGRVFSGAGRWAAAGLLVTGAVLQLAEFMLSSSSDESSARVDYWLAHPTATNWSMALGLLAVPFLIGGFAVLVTITMRHSRRLALAAAVLLTLAMCGLAGVHGYEISAFSLATDGQESAAVSVLDADGFVAPMAVLLIMFLGGAVFGTLTLAAAVWRSPMLPKLGAIGIVAFAVIDFAVGMPVVSHAVAVANSVVLAWAVVAGRSSIRHQVPQ